MRWLLYRFYCLMRRPLGWMRRRMTTIGATVLVGIALTGGSYSRDQTLGGPVVLVLAGLIACSMAILPFVRLRFSIERRLPRFITVGQPVVLQAVVANRCRRRLTGLEYREMLPEAVRTYREFCEQLAWRGNRPPRPGRTRPPQVRMALVPPIEPGGEAEVGVRLVAWRRGILRFDHALIGVSDPFGLIRTFTRISRKQSILVLPRRHPVPPLPLPGRSHAETGGQAIAAGVGEAEEFVAMRDYRRGDSLRRVHWRSSARLGRLVVKECQDERMVHHALVLDTRVPVSQGTLFEEAVSVAASFACTVPDQDALLDLLIAGSTVVAIGSTQDGGAERMLEALAVVNPTEEDHLVAVEPEILRHAGLLGSCLLVLLRWDATRRDLVRRLEALGVPCVVMLVVPDDYQDGDPVDPPQRLLILREGSIPADLQRIAEVRS